MSDSVREKICQAMLARFAAISVTNGFKTNFVTVKRWFPEDFNDDQLPALNVKDVKCSFTDEGNNRAHDFILEVHAEAFSKPGTNWGASSVEMLNDLSKAIGSDMYWTLSSERLAYRTTPFEDETAMDQKDTIKAAVRMKFKVHFRTAPFDPYTNRIS